MTKPKTQTMTPVKHKDVFVSLYYNPASKNVWILC